MNHSRKNNLNFGICITPYLQTTIFVSIQVDSYLKLSVHFSVKLGLDSLMRRWKLHPALFFH